MPSTNYAYVNGRFVPEAVAAVSIFDRGFLYGDGAFETMRVYGGKIFRPATHLTRLMAGLEFLGIVSPLSPGELRAACDVLLDRNGVQDGVVRVYVTRGTGDFGPSSSADMDASVVILAQARTFADTRLKVIVASNRLDTNLSRHKTANRLPYIQARHEAEKTNADEAILLNHSKRVVEFTASNLFLVKEGELYTPPLDDGPLPGVTRSVVLSLAEQERIKTHEQSFGEDVLYEADELFATNSLVEVAPVVALTCRRYPTAVALRLRESYRQLVREELGL